MQPTSCLTGGNAAFIEGLYETYLADPSGVPVEWQSYFAAMQTPGMPGDRAHQPIRDRIVALATNSIPAPASTVDDGKQVAVLQLINAYRFMGHRQARLDPLNQHERPHVPELDIEFHGLGSQDLERIFNTGSLQGRDSHHESLREMVAILKQTYCATIGAEYMHIVETAQKRWIQQRLEPIRSQLQLGPEKKRWLLDRLVAAGALEEYLHTKYVGQKRFSLEGGESAIALLDQVLVDAARHGTKEVVIGMAHRGRLNVLVNIVGKHPSKLFDEFEGRSREARLGDVKYHLGYSSDIETPHGAVHVTLAFNPSHLEIIDPVVEGSVRARQDRRGDLERKQVLPLLIHGDAAFAGQGVVMETFNLSQTRGYTTGGTVHVIINNQIGFTTSDPLDSRSTLYCTDVAKMVQAPIFHVNADDPEAVALVAQIALDFRMEFAKDVVVDFVCYRKHGHSEADEPAATQPLMYQHVRRHPGVRKIYADKLVGEAILKPGEAEKMARHYVAALEKKVAVSRPAAAVHDTRYLINYEPYRHSHWRDAAITGLPRARIGELTERLTTYPKQFELHRAVKKIVQDRQHMAKGEAPIDWGYAESLAYAALVTEGHAVRISGQDSARGTFFHRHAVFHDQKSGDTYLPLQNIAKDQASFLVINSTLSEEAVLGFEYG
ncbi:MAG: 2-oxoglutarate dehydrogenase E1 component, partial [Gammaproteobacteria bacterium]